MATCESAVQLLVSICFASAQKGCFLQLLRDYRHDNGCVFVCIPWVGTSRSQKECGRTDKSKIYPIQLIIFFFCLLARDCQILERVQEKVWKQLLREGDVVRPIPLVIGYEPQDATKMNWAAFCKSLEVQLTVK